MSGHVSRAWDLCKQLQGETPDSGGKERQEGGLVAKEARKEERGEGLRSRKQLAVGGGAEKAPPMEPEGLISVSLQSLTRACQELQRICGCLYCHYDLGCINPP